MGKPTVRVAGGQAAMQTEGYGTQCSYTSPATFFSGYAYNNGAATAYLFIFDAIADPGDGSDPVLPPLAIAAGTNTSLDFWAGHSFGTGITIVASSTATTLTELVAGTVAIFATVR